MHFFLLGRNVELSRAELAPVCDEVFFDKDKNFLLADHLKWINPRDLPKTKEQNFLDRLGGTVRMGKILGEFFSKKELVESLVDCVEKDHHHAKEQGKKSDIYKIAFMVMGGGKTLMNEVQNSVKILEKKLDFKVRYENASGKNLTSGSLFDRKVLRGGGEFLIMKKGDSFLLGQTKANQNLRNYVLRDRRKPFRDAKMGMLPPKLAQILINLANPTEDDTVYDPFCGSGTLCAEAALMGFKTKGSDLNSRYVKGAEENFDFLSQKFRFDKNLGKFFVEDASNTQWKSRTNGVICTEGFLGENFDSYARVSRLDIEKEAKKVLDIWKTIFNSLERAEGIREVIFCLPSWNMREQTVSISDRLFRKLPSNFKVGRVTKEFDTFVYERSDTRVGREICRLVRV